jgi:hypothetical protein
VCPEISVAGNSKKDFSSFLFFSDFDFDFDDLAASQLQSADLGLVELDHPAEKILTWDWKYYYITP